MAPTRGSPITASVDGKVETPGMTYKSASSFRRSYAISSGEPRCTERADPPAYVERKPRHERDAHEAKARAVHSWACAYRIGSVVMSEAAPAGTDPLLGRTIADKFHIESLVGKGAMGAVYKATQLNLKKRVAIKVMNPDKKDGTYASRFKREAKAAARMEHPNLIRVIDFGEEPDGLLYIAMEFIEGRDRSTFCAMSFPSTTRAS